MYNGQKIREILRERGIKNVTLLEAMGWKNNNSLRQVIEGNPSAELLEKICNLLEIPIDDLFDRPCYKSPTEREDALMNVIEEQKRTIDVLHELLKQFRC